MKTKPLPILAALLVILLSLSACGQNANKGRTNVTVQIGSLQTAAARSLAPQIPLTVSQIRIDISGIDMEPISSVTGTSGTAVFQATFSVPDGPARHFNAVAEDAAGNALFHGTATADLSGSPVIVPLQMTATSGIYAPFQTVNSSIALYDVLYGSGKYFAVGDFGSIMTSLDGISWQTQNLGISEGLFSIAMNPSSAVFVGETGIVITVLNSSAATPTYKKQYLIGPQSMPILSLNGVAWSGTTFTAVGNGGNVLTSPDGLVWTINASNVNDDMNGVIGNNANLLAVGRSGRIIRSIDTGLTWATITSGTAADLYHVASNSSLAAPILVIAGDFGTILRSTDLGATWAPQTSGTTSALFNVAWNGSSFIASGANGTILTSPDGITWTQRTTTTGNPLHGIYGSPALTVIVGASKTILSSADTVTWTTNSEDMVTMMNSVVWTGSQFVTVGIRGTILTSPSGNIGTWTKQTSGTFNDLYIVKSSGTRLVATGTNRTIIGSADGITWSAAAVPTGAANAIFRGLAWSGTQFVAVGDVGAVLTSPDGITWTTQSSGVTENLNSVAWAGDQFVAVGDSGRIITSPNAVVWTARPSSTILRLNGVTWSTTQIVAVGDFSTIVKSNNGGLSWTLHTSATAADLLFPPVPHLVSVYWTGYEFLAVSTNGTILRSLDGAGWRPLMISISRQLNDITWVPNTRSIMAVGYNTILLSRSAPTVALP